MKIKTLLLLPAIAILASATAAFSHDTGAVHDEGRIGARDFSAQPPREMIEILRSGKGIPAADSDAIRALTARYLSRRSNRPVGADVTQTFLPADGSKRGQTGMSASPRAATPSWQFITTPFSLSDVSVSDAFTLTSYTAPAGNGALMAASFAAFKPKVRFHWDGTTFYEESDNTPDNMPNKMVGITSWQQQIPVPAAYFANTVNPENSATSLGYKQPNYWRLPLVPVPSSSHYSISSGNFQRGAVALASNGIAIFNPKNNTGAVSYEIGELDAYGGHCGLADDYHYHIIPTHLQSTFGGPLSNDKPVAWALDGYPIYGFTEPDGTARQALDADGGHDIGSGWGYHYHAIGTTATDTTVKNKYGSHATPYLMSSFHGTVVNFGTAPQTQVDGQPEVGPIRGSGTGGYTASPVSGASIIAFKNPVALTFATDAASTQGTGAIHLTENVGGTASADAYLMRVSIGGTSYDECWTINRNVNPRTMTVTWRLAGATTTTTYTPTAGTAAGNRLATYTMAASSQTNIPDTSQTIDTTATFGEDADYTIHPQSFTDNGNGTITDNVTGLMWQKTDNGESTWETAVANAAGIATGGFSDWRLPTPSELFSIFNHNNANPALNATFFPNNGAGTADYWWTSDISGSSTTNVWCSNAGGGLGPKPKAETISAGGVLRYSARYVRGAKPTNAHNYLNNGDGTITDLDTGLMWTQIPAASTTWDAALTYAENLSLGGFSDWRLPNVKELQTLSDYTLANAVTPVVKASMNQTMFAKTLTACVTSAGGTTITCADTTGLLPGMPLVDPASVAGTYIPYVTPPVVNAVTSGTTFTVTSGTGIVAGSNLTLKVLPPPTAFWTSTSQNNATANAWVVEFGTNNTSTPPRNAQGIISYNVKTGTYPVFAVRTTSTTTQIAVEQPSGNALTDGVSTVSYGNVNVGSTSAKTFVIRNNGGTSLTITGVTIDGTNAANFSVTASPATTIAAGASTTVDVQFNAATAGNKVAVLHIASSDSSVGAAFDITLSGTGYIPPPTVTNATTNPAVPSNLDTPFVSATVTPSNGATISSVQLTYNTGAQVTAPVFQEIFSNASTTGGLAGAMNTWTATSVRAAADVKERGSTGNRTVPIVLTNCTTNGTTTVTCASTTGLIPGMSVSGANIAGTAAISSITNSTTFVMSVAATGSGTGLSLTAAGVSLTGCSLGTSPTINCASTTGLSVGMGIAGAGLTTNPPNPTVLAITSATTFTVNSTVTVVPATLTASGTGLALSNGTANYTDTMATSGALSATAPTAGYVEFYVRNADLFSGNGWTFQIAPDGNLASPNYVTRLSENFAASGSTNCTLNATTAVTCSPISDASKFTVGSSIQGIPVSIALCTVTTGSTTVTTTNTTGLVVGMIISGPAAASIPNNARITAISPGASFTLSAAPTPATSPTTQTLTANYLPGNATVSAINTTTGTLTLNTAAFVTGSGITLSSVNHAFALKHYDLVAADMSANMKMRFQFSGYSGAVGPARPPEVDIDDITVIFTTGAPPVTVTMYDDGLHGDGAAGDGVFGVQLPAFAAGTTVSYSIAATDSNGSTTTLASAGSYTTGQAPTITSSATLPNATPNAAYSTTLAATGGAGGNVWSIVSGALPNGVTLSSAGVISGTPTAQGTFNVTIKVTDSAGRMASKAFTLTVTTTTPPNVVIILTDDQGWADIGYHTASGQVPVQTPNMDSFGTTGIRLEKFYPTTVCAVTRGCLLTGRNSLRTGVGNQKGLSTVEHLMPQTFKAAGYQTFMCGKWHIGGWDNNIYTTTMNGATIDVQHEGFDYHPIARGWDFHKGQYGGAINYFTHTTVDPGKNSAIDWWQNNVQLLNDNTDLQGHGGYSTDLLADKAVEQIVNRDKAKPMLLYLAFNAIHAGVSAPQSYLNKYAALGVTGGRQTICAAVDCMDVAMGRVLAALDSEGITNNTLVVFMSDNGGDTTTGSLNIPLRGTKSDSYDGGLHTPAAIRWPGHLAAGVTSNQYVWVGDIFPTVCAAVGVTPQNTKAFDGVNIWPQLQSITAGSLDGAPRGVPLVTGDAGGPVALNLFTDPVNGGTKVFKLIRTPGTTVVNELFNLTDDPYETTDILLGANAAAHSTIVTTLTSAITGIVTESYPPNIGISGITQTVVAGGNITLYAPFTSYKVAPTVQWKKNGANITSTTPFYQVTNSTGGNVAGVYMATLPLPNVTPADAASYTATVTNSNGTVTSPVGTLTVNATPQQSWWFTHFGTITPPATGNAALLSDPDGDGLANLAEWAFGLDPALSDGTGMNLNGSTISKRGIPSITSAGGNFYAMFGRRKDYLTAGLTYTVHFSADLTSWENSTTAPTVIATDAEMDAVTVPFPSLLGSGAKPKFFRLRISTP